MGESIKQIAAFDAGVPDDGLLCPKCGYDLRSNTTERCSECGEIIDRAALTISNFPWAHRREIGRIKAYWKTVWLVSVDHPRLRHEVVKAQDLRSAKAFRRITALMVAAVLLALFASAVLKHENLSFLAVDRPTSIRNPNMRWIFDLAVPWSAGATIIPVIPLALVMLAFYLTTAHQRLFRLKDSSPSRQERARVIANYAIAPLAALPVLAILGITVYFTQLDQSCVAFLAVIVALGGFALRLYRGLSGKPASQWILPLTLLLATVIFVASTIFPIQAVWFMPYRLGAALSVAGFVAGIAAVFRIAQWSARVRHSGLERALFEIPLLLGLWLLGAVVLLGLFPWCVGFVWIVIDSFL